MDFYGPNFDVTVMGHTTNRKWDPPRGWNCYLILYLPPTSRHTCSSLGRMGLGGEGDMGVSWLFDSARVSHATSEESLTRGREERKKENEPTKQTQVQGTPRPIALNTNNQGPRSRMYDLDWPCFVILFFSFNLIFVVSCNFPSVLHKSFLHIKKSLYPFVDSKTKNRLFFFSKSSVSSILKKLMITNFTNINFEKDIFEHKNILSNNHFYANNFDQEGTQRLMVGLKNKTPLFFWLQLKKGGTKRRPIKKPNRNQNQGRISLSNYAYNWPQRS